MQDDEETIIPLDELPEHLRLTLDHLLSFESRPELKPGKYRFPDGSIRKPLPDGTKFACGGIVSKEALECIMSEPVGMGHYLEKFAPQEAQSNNDIARALHDTLEKMKQNTGR